MSARVLIAMGSDSDLPVMREAAEVLSELGVPADLRILSAHRTPKRMLEAAETAEQQGYAVIVAGAGGAAHLPGMMASLTPLPVVGVPIRSRKSLDGWDSLLSIAQMPPGVPVATVAVDGGRNAGILAAQILGAGNDHIRRKVETMKLALADKVLEKADKLEREGPDAFPPR